MELLEWQNLVFAIPIATAFILLLLTAIGGIGHGGGHDCGDHGLHLGDHGHDGGMHAHDGAHGHDGHGHGHDHEQGAFSKVLDLIGIGRIPMTLAMTLVLILFGTIGLCSNMINEGMRISPSIYFNLSLLIATIGSLALTRLLIPLVARCIPKDESQAITPHDFIGMMGTSILPINGSAGRFHINDRYGSLHEFYARTAGEEIAANKQIVIEDYIAEGNYYRVSQLNLED